MGAEDGVPSNSLAQPGGCGYSSLLPFAAGAERIGCRAANEWFNGFVARTEAMKDKRGVQSAQRPPVMSHAFVVLVEAVVEEDAVFFPEQHLALFFDADGQVIVVADGNGVRLFQGFIEQAVAPFDFFVVHLDDHLPEQLAEPEFDQMFLIASDFQAEFHKMCS
jgi:hypothetical protein